MARPSPTGTAGAAAPTSRPRYELADVVRACADDYLRTHPATTTRQRKVLRALARCRTAALGGHVQGCVRCGYRRIAYNSCLMGSLRLWRAQPAKG